MTRISGENAQNGRAFKNLLSLARIMERISRNLESSDGNLASITKEFPKEK